MATATKSAVGPVEHIAGIPVFKHGTAPKHLRSKTRLRTGLRLKPGPGQVPECYVIPYYHPDERRALYDPAAAVPVADQRIGSIWAWRARRTCPKCGVLREYVIIGGQCGRCQRAERLAKAAKAERRCDGCRRLGRKPYREVVEGWYRKRLCPTCRAARRVALEEALAEVVLCPGGCGKRTSAKTRILAWAIENRYSVSRWQRVYCPPCDAVHKAEVEARQVEQRERWERERAEERAREEARVAQRRAELAELREWATAALADPDVVILDTETTGLHATARIVEISITDTAGRVLLDTLVNPGEPIPDDASGIHGITDAMVAGAPTFAEILPRLEAAVRGKRVLIYNADYDTARIQHELEIHLGGVHPAQRAFDPAETGAAAKWMTLAEWEDAMEPYAIWYGEWSDWHGNYRWQPLGGGHRALGDCLAVIDCLKAMARPSVYESEDEDD